MAGGCHLRAGDVFAFPGGTLVAHVVFAGADRDRAHGGLGSILAVATAGHGEHDDQRNPVHNLLWELITVVGLRFAR